MIERKTIYRVGDKVPEIEERRRLYTPGYIYLLRIVGTEGVYKIGESENVENRINTFLKNRRYQAEIVFSVKVKDKWPVENALHEHFAQYRLAGEWFALSPENLEEILNIISETDKNL